MPDTTESAETVVAKPDRPQRWPLWPTIGVVCAAVVLQQLFLNCLCWQGAAKTNFAGIVDLLIAIRLLAGWLFRETGRGWVYYYVVLLTSPLWAHLAFWYVIGRHG